MSNLIVGAQLYSIRDRTQSAEQMLEALKAIKAIGYNTCQLSGQSKAITVLEQRAMLDEAGLACASTHIGFEEMEEDIDSVIANHKLLGCAYPGIGGMPARFREGGAEGFIAFAREATKIAEKLRDNGLTFVYHNHNFEFARFGEKTGMDLLMENTSSAVQFELDVFWVQAGGASPLDWIEKLGGRMDVVHFKEMGYGEGMTVKMTPIGEGNMNWKKILDACDAIGARYALVEQDNAIESDSINCMRRSFENLRSVGASF